MSQASASTSEMLNWFLGSSAPDDWRCVYKEVNPWMVRNRLRLFSCSMLSILDQLAPNMAKLLMKSRKPEWTNPKPIMLHVIVTCQCGQNFEILFVQQLLKCIFKSIPSVCGLGHNPSNPCSYPLLHDTIHPLPPTPPGLQRRLVFMQSSSQCSYWKYILLGCVLEWVAASVLWGQEALHLWTTARCHTAARWFKEGARQELTNSTGWTVSSKSSPLSAVVLSFQHLVVNSATSQYLCGMNTKSFSTQHSIPGIYTLYVFSRLPGLFSCSMSCLDFQQENWLVKHQHAAWQWFKGADLLALCPASTSSKKTGSSSSSMPPGSGSRVQTFLLYVLPRQKGAASVSCFDFQQVKQ